MVATRSGGEGHRELGNVEALMLESVEKTMRSGLLCTTREVTDRERE